MLRLRTFISLLTLGLFLISPLPAQTQEVASEAKALPISSETLQQTLLETLQIFRSLKSGKVYISGSEKVDPDWFGIAIATFDGQIFTVGDADRAFPIQSISKLFVYGLALEDHGLKIMLEKVGVNATGLPYNSIIASDVRAPSKGNPKALQNPMVSAGAIATASLIKGATEQEQWERVLSMYARYAGRELMLNEQVYQAEMKNAAMTRALAELLSAYNLLYSGVDVTVDRYLKGTSVNITAKDLAIMGATLANGGINPLTNERAVEENIAVRLKLEQNQLVGISD